jgi:GH15 family glucan-1,4-alpha-glucosidase
VRLEDYALIGDLETAALVGRDGSVDWLCVPRFDSPACFAALLGDERNGRWSLAPAGAARAMRRYRGAGLVLETDFATAEGSVRVLDLMPPRSGAPALLRVVEGLHGRVDMRMDLALRFEYGAAVPWVTRTADGLQAVKGAHALALRAPVPLRAEGMTTVAEFQVRPGDRLVFALQWHPSHEPPPPAPDAAAELARTEAFWETWAARSTYSGRHAEPVARSLAVLKALTHAPTGGIVAAPTTSLPEQLGGGRNWDYRYCWVRDAALTVSAMIGCGYLDEALAFRDWLLRATAGDPARARIMYTIDGEPLPPEQLIEGLPGYEGSAPVRIGNAAAEQLQLDVYGELLEVGHLGRQTARALGMPAADPRMWRRNLALLAHLESVWREPDEGIWEVRGPRRHFTHSKLMAWVAFDRAVKAVEELGNDGPADRWRRVRAEVHDEVCREAWDAERRTFTQSYGSAELDAAVLLMPAVGFLPASDERVQGTIAAVQRELCDGGLVFRYPSADGEHGVDGLAGREGAFLPCSFWLADALALSGRVAEAEELFERLLGLRNDLGLLAEEYDVDRERLVGNFPQAFTHLALIHTAQRLEAAPRAIACRARRSAASSPEKEIAPQP